MTTISAMHKLAYFTTQVSLPCLTAQGSLCSMDFSNAIRSSSGIGSASSAALMLQSRLAAVVPDEAGRAFTIRGCSCFDLDRVGQIFAVEQRALGGERLAHRLRRHAALDREVRGRNAGGLPGGERRAHDPQRSSRDAIAVRGPAGGEQVANVAAHQRAQRNVVGFA